MATPNAASQTGASQMGVWDDEHLPAPQRENKRNEFDAVAQLVKNAGPQCDLVDIGCGDAAIAAWLIEQGVPFGSYTGIDVDADEILKARERFAGEPRVFFADAGNFITRLPELVLARQKPFDLLICLGNTLGTMRRPNEAPIYPVADLPAAARKLFADRTAHIRTMAEGTNRLFVSVYRCDEDVLNLRLVYYRTNQIPCQVDWTTNIIVSATWQASLAWTPEQLDEAGRSVADLGFAEPTVIELAPMGHLLEVARAGM